MIEHREHPNSETHDRHSTSQYYAGIVYTCAALSDCASKVWIEFKCCVFYLVRQVRCSNTAEAAAAAIRICYRMKFYLTNCDKQ